MNTLFAISAALLYALAAAVLIGKFVHQDGPNKRLGLSIASVGAIAHIAFLTNVIIVAPGQDMSVTNVLSLVSWIITVSMLIFARAIPNLILLPVVFGFARSYGTRLTVYSRVVHHAHRAAAGLSYPY